MVLAGFLSTAYFGSTLEQYALFLTFLAASVLVAKAVHYALVGYGRTVALRAKKDFDGVVLGAIERPLVFGGFIVGLALGYQFLTLNLDFVSRNFTSAVNALIILDLAWLSLKLVDGFISSIVMPIAARAKTTIGNQLAPGLGKAAKALIVSAALIMILALFGIDVLPLLAGLGIGGLAIAFAAQKTVEDVFGGISIFTGKPFLVKDIVRLKGIEGDVEKIGIRYTRIRDNDGRLVTIPNAQVSQDVIVNVSSEPSRRIQMTLGLTCGTKSEKIREAISILEEIAAKHPSTDKAPGKAKAIFKNYGQSSLDTWFFYHIKDKGRILETQNEINLEIKKRFEKAGIEFAFPTQTLYIEKLPKAK